MVNNALREATADLIMALRMVIQYGRLTDADVEVVAARLEAVVRAATHAE